ncbi:MAG: hypothetical protein VSS52_002795 [Thiotrichaceae bacterium]
MPFAMLVILTNEVELTYVLMSIVNWGTTIFLFTVIFRIFYSLSGKLGQLFGLLIAMMMILVFTVVFNTLLMSPSFINLNQKMEKNKEIGMFFMKDEKYIQTLLAYLGVTVQFVPTSAKLACSAKHFLSEENSCVVYKIQNKNSERGIVDFDTPFKNFFEKIDNIPYLHTRTQYLISTLKQNYELINKLNMNFSKLEKQTREAKIQANFGKSILFLIPSKEKWFFSSNIMDDIDSLLSEVPNITSLKGKSLDDDLIDEMLADLNKLKANAKKIEASQQELMILLLDNKLPIALDIDYYNSNSLIVAILIKILIIILLYVWGVKNIFRRSRSL